MRELSLCAARFGRENHARPVGASSRGDADQLTDLGIHTPVSNRLTHGTAAKTFSAQPGRSHDGLPTRNGRRVC